MRVDEAIDLVGRALFPDEWGRQRDFDMLPLFFRSGRTGLYTLVPNKKTRFHRVDVEDPTPSMGDWCATGYPLLSLTRRHKAEPAPPIGVQREL